MTLNVKMLMEFDGIIFYREFDRQVKENDDKIKGLYRQHYNNLTTTSQWFCHALCHVIHALCVG